MKKLFTIALLSVSLLGFSAATSQAQICVELVGFCDQLELQVDGDNNVYGVWDYTCDGVTLHPMQGFFNPPTVTVGTYIPALGSTFFFIFDIPSRTFDLWGWDGINPPFQYQNDSPWDFAVGPCVFSISGEQLPSLLGDYLDREVE